MAIFPLIETDGIVQTNDRLRIKGSSTFISKDEAAITLVEIEPEAGNGYIDVTGSSSDDWYLDWAYSGTSRTVTVGLRVTTDGAPVVSTVDVDVVTAADDKLFSDDKGLLRLESDIMDFLPKDRSSFIFMHRKARDLILDWFNEMGYRNLDGTKITADEVLDVDEVRRWAEYQTLSLIFQDASNIVDDKHDVKSKHYDSRAVDAKRRAVVHLDLNKDGDVDINEGVNISSVDLVRR